MDFPLFVYLGFGPHQRPGGGYTFRVAKDQADLDAALDAGWFLSLPEAIAANDSGEAPEQPKKRGRKPKNELD